MANSLIGKNQNFNYLFCPKGKGYAISFRKLLEPFNNVKSLPLGSYWHTESEYCSKGLTNSLNPSINIRKCILRFVYLKTNDKKLGYIAYDKQTGDLYTGYWDGTTEEFNDYVLGNTTTPATDRTIHMHSKLTKNGGYQQIDAAWISEGNTTTPYKIGDNVGEHTACAYLFHSLCQIYFEPEKTSNGTNETTQWVIADMLKMLSESYVKFLGGGLDERFVDDYGELLTYTENELYVNFGCDYEGQSPMFPFNQVNLSDEQIEKIKDDENSTYWVENSNIIKNSKKIKLKAKKILDVGAYVSSGEYLIESYKFKNNDEELVPKECDHFIPNKFIKKTMDIIKNNAKLPEPVILNFLFRGDAGTGKSVGSKMVARMCGLPYRFITLSANSQEDDLFLNILPGEEAGTFIHNESEFVKAFENGGVIEFREANTPKNDAILTCLNSALDDSGIIQLKNGKVIKRHPNCIVIFTINNGYNGTRAMNQSVLSRFPGKFNFEIPKNQELIRELVAKSGIDASVADKMTRCMEDMQKILFEESEENGVCSFREIVNWAKMYQLLGDIHESAEISIINSATTDENTAVLLKQAVCNYFE